MNTVQDVNADTQNGEAEEVQPLADDATEDQRAAHYAQLEENNRQLFARAKKAEGFEKNSEGKWVKKTVAPKNEEKKPEPTAKDTSKLSQTDLIAIARADIHDDDIDEVLEYAKLKNLSFADALKTTVVKGILSDKTEQRRVAAGTSTGGAPRGSAKLSDESLVANARAGKMPESDEDINRLARLQLGIK